jgi:hypothetical protein
VLDTFIIIIIIIVKNTALWLDVWTRETWTGQQVAQLHDRYMIMIMMKNTTSWIS